MLTAYTFSYIILFIIACTTSTYKNINTVGSRFATIHFYDPCRVGPSTHDLWCIAVSTQAFFYLLSALLVLCRCACVSSFSTLVQFF